MIAYKFLGVGGVGRFSGVRWPAPATEEWVQAPAGAPWPFVSACRVCDLPWWLGEELWEVELAEPVRPMSHKLQAPAGRLRARIDAWTPECAADYASACSAHLRDRFVTALGARAPGPLARAASLSEVVILVQQVADRPEPVELALDALSTSAIVTVSGGPPLAAYTTAHVADRLDHVEGYADERAWQARWLAQRLGLDADA